MKWSLLAAVLLIGAGLGWYFTHEAQEPIKTQYVAESEPKPVVKPELDAVGTTDSDLEQNLVQISAQVALSASSTDAASTFVDKQIEQLE